MSVGYNLLSLHYLADISSFRQNQYPGHPVLYDEHV